MLIMEGYNENVEEWREDAPLIINIMRELSCIITFIIDSYSQDLSYSPQLIIYNMVNIIR